MPRLAGGGRLIEMDIEEPGTKGRQGEPGGGGERPGRLDGQAHMRQGEEGLGQTTEIAGAAGQADNFVDGGTGFFELGEQAFEAERGQLSFEGVGGENEIPFGAAKGPKNAAQPGEVGQFEIDRICERQEGEEEKNPLPRTPVEGTALFPGPKGQKDGNLLFGHRLEDFLRLHALGEQEVQTDFSKIDSGWRVGQMPKAFFRGNRANR